MLTYLTFQLYVSVNAKIYTISMQIKSLLTCMIWCQPPFLCVSSHPGFKYHQWVELHAHNCFKTWFPCVLLTFVCRVFQIIVNCKITILRVNLIYLVLLKK